MSKDQKNIIYIEATNGEYNKKLLLIPIKDLSLTQVIHSEIGCILQSYKRYKILLLMICTIPVNTHE